MTMAQIAAYQDYFLRQPPTHIVAAWAVGYKRPPSSRGVPAPLPEFATLPDVEE